MQNGEPSSNTGRSSTGAAHQQQQQLNLGSPPWHTVTHNSQIPKKPPPSDSPARTTPAPLFASPTGNTGCAPLLFPREIFKFNFSVSSTLSTATGALEPYKKPPDPRTATTLAHSLDTHMGAAQDNHLRHEWISTLLHRVSPQQPVASCRLSLSASSAAASASSPLVPDLARNKSAIESTVIQAAALHLHPTELTHSTVLWQNELTVVCGWKMEQMNW